MRNLKKYLLTILILTLSSGFAKSAELFNNNEELEDFHETFYEAPMTPIPEVKPVHQGYEIKGMPVFKKTRIKITNYFKEKEYKKQQELLKKEQLEFQKFEAEENEKANKIFNKKEKVNKPNEQETPVLELEGSISQETVPNDAMLDADNIDYNEETMDIIATGNPILKFPPRGVSIKADKLVYNQASNTIKANGNVQVVKNGNTVYGDYMQINMNEENAFIDNMTTKESFMTIKARKSEIDGDKIVLFNGKMISEDSYILDLHTKMIGGNHFNTMMIDDEDRSSITDEIGKTSIHIKAKEIFVNAKKDHDTITLKKASIFYGDHKLLRFNSFTAHTDKRHEYFEANYPEIGSRSQIGMFAGPGFAFDVPGAGTMKVVPFLNYKGSKLGFGGALKYRSATNYTDLMYGSSNDVWVAKGRQYLDDKLMLQYGSNSFMNEWFFGPRMSKYNAELIYRDKTTVKSPFKKDYDLAFQHRASFGYFQNSDINRKNENLPASNMGTTRLRYMAQIAQPFYRYQDNEKLRQVELAWVMRGSAAVYGTGDTQFVGQVGPMIRTQYKYWLQNIGAFGSAYHDETPMERFDTYRYGHANVYIKEALRLNKYLTVAWSGTISLTGDAPNGKMFQENSFIVALGPDDFKLNLGYDWIRRQTYFSFIIAMDTKGSSIEYDKMVIKNPERLARSDKEYPKPIVFDEVPVNRKMKYAEVIDIEDPDKEQI